jgi:hypothetical protein
MKRSKVGPGGGRVLDSTRLSSFKLPFCNNVVLVNKKEPDLTMILENVFVGVTCM